MGIMSILDKVVTIFVIFAFTMAAAMKLYPFVPTVHNEMIEKFKTYAPTCPTVYLGYTPTPDTYRIVVGIWEAFCAAGMLLSTDLKGVTSFILTVIMSGALYTHFAVDDVQGAPVPAVLLLMCLFLFVRSRMDRAVQQKQKSE